MGYIRPPQASVIKLLSSIFHKKSSSYIIYRILNTTLEKSHGKVIDRNKWWRIDYGDNWPRIHWWRELMEKWFFKIARNAYNQTTNLRDIFQIFVLKQTENYALQMAKLRLFEKRECSLNQSQFNHSLNTAQIQSIFQVTFTCSKSTIEAVEKGLLKVLC